MALQTCRSELAVFAVELEKRSLPGNFAYAVHHLLENDFDLSGFDARYLNDDSGDSAYPSGMLRGQVAPFLCPEYRYKVFSTASASR